MTQRDATKQRKIIFDSRWMGTHGIGRFATELNNRLPCLDEQTLSGSPTSPLDCLRLGYTIWKNDGAYFSPSYNAPLSWLVSTKRPFVFTIHDLIHVNYPAESSLPKRLYYQYVIRPAARKAFKVLTVSEFSKQEIVAWSGVDPSHVGVVYNGVGSAFKVDGPKRETEYDYLLYVGNQKAHKNVTGLLHALAEVRKTVDVHLEITGKAEPHTTATIEKLGLSQHVHFLGSVTDDELACAYRGARATVLASEYEGFGLPVIESMACGTPVVCSNVTSLPEIAGGAAVLVDIDAESIAAGILRLLNDESLQQELVLAGRKRAADFSWEATSAKVLEVVGQLAGDESQCVERIVSPLEATSQ
ncbi:glycosyltransferase family 4 protein [Rhodopirellula sp. SWK7]|uniref:glycosyltransferase family 4 protein n=1 Tax=Rhodopirellula sp. SWK7 TaxID=595460 RepID=UPI00034AC593|nr:glycosyltransferase family 1 protein [Rhodopirellula sp. SWK7]